MDLIHKINMEDDFTYFNFNFLFFIALNIKCFQVKTQLSIKFKIKGNIMTAVHTMVQRGQLPFLSKC